METTAKVYKLADYRTAPVAPTPEATSPEHVAGCPIGSRAEIADAPIRKKMQPLIDRLAGNLPAYANEMLLRYEDACDARDALKTIRRQLRRAFRDEPILIDGVNTPLNLGQYLEQRQRSREALLHRMHDQAKAIEDWHKAVMNNPRGLNGVSAGKVARMLRVRRTWGWPSI